MRVVCLIQNSRGFGFPNKRESKSFANTKCFTVLELKKRLFACLPVRVCLSVWFSVYVAQSLSLPICLSVSKSACVSLCRSVCLALFFCLCVCLSFFLSPALCLCLSLSPLWKNGDRSFCSLFVDKTKSAGQNPPIRPHR